MPDENFQFEMVPMKRSGFFWVTFSGDFSLEALAGAHEKFTNHPDYLPGIDELLDFSNCSIGSVSAEQIDRIRDYMSARPDRHSNKSVIVVSSALEFGVGRMMGSYLDDAVPVDRFVCYSVPQALEWLRPGQQDELLAVHQKYLDGANLRP